MFKENKDKDFKCTYCKKIVSQESYGTKNRNHCPHCLWSKHVDEVIGERDSKCGGSMKPLGLSTKKDGELMIVHKCDKCKKISKNRIAGDDDTNKILEILKSSKSSRENIDFFTDEEEAKEQLFGKIDFS